MGRLVEGKWVYDNAVPLVDGKLIRPPSLFRERISREPGTKYTAVAGRYHLYVGLGCPWTSRTLIMRKLKNLEDPITGDNGWEFSDHPGCIPDFLYKSHYLYEIYIRVVPSCTCQVSVPML